MPPRSTTIPSPDTPSNQASLSSNQEQQSTISAGVISAIVIGSLLCCLLCLFLFFRRKEYLKEVVYGKDTNLEMSSWMKSKSGGITLMKREVDDDEFGWDGLSEGEKTRQRYSFLNMARSTLRSIRLTALVGLVDGETYNNNPMQSSISSSSQSTTSTVEAKKRVTSGEFHMNYLGYGESASDTPTMSSSHNIVSENPSSKIRLDQDRARIL